MNINLQTHHSKTYKELSEIPLAEWNRDHISTARRAISIECYRRFEKYASECSDGQVRSRLVKLLGHFNQLKVLALESDTAAISIERARARVDQIAVRRQSTPVIRKTGLDIRRVLGWFGLVRR